MLFKQEISNWFKAEQDRFFLWSPVGLMLGIDAYFTMMEEPPIWLGAAALAVCLCLLAASWRTRLRVFIIPLVLFALGFSAAQFRAHVVTTTLLTEELRNRIVEGTIDEIEPVEKREKLVLSHLSIEELSAAETPKRVRISFRGEETSLQVGDCVRMTANLYPLPGPTMPGSYDFARHFYFRSIGGNGFAFRPPEVITSNDNSGAAAWLNNLRHSIGEDMRTRIGGEAGAVAAAMTVGESGPIPADVKTVLRDSGLAHMLAIAGLHLGIVTGIVFFNVRLLLTLVPAFALRLPVKKISAAGALFSAFVYLSLAGYPIPAQRAFIMVTFLFSAVMLDRRGITLRTLMIAAIIILLVFPESMFGASFQMSFAATLAIVALYERYGRSLFHGRASFIRKVWQHAFGIAATSMVATLATSPFVLYHFNRFALFGLITNMVVIPLATFIIMPGMVLWVLLLPLGLQMIGYYPLAYGVEMMIGMARWVVSLPYASLHLPSPTDTGLMLAALGLLWLCLMKTRARLLGFPVIALGLATLTAHVPVDVFIGADARQVMVRLAEGRYTTLRGTARSFTVQNWLRAEGEDELVSLKETDMECDKTLCTYHHHGRTLILVKKPQETNVLDSACGKPSDVLIAWWYLHPDRCPGAKMLIGRAELENHGAHTLRFGDTIQISRTREKGEGQRIWHPRLRLNDAADDD